MDELPVVKHLNLRDNRLSDKAMNDIVDELTKPDRIMTLYSLDLSQNDIYEETAEKLAGFLKSKA